ncbi:hypothetical protein [Flavisphingomonas formosensis]|uniref:hypothetical protein n=1 Tax=Flavisphingomonas formosensis TaxID=861534 RepID=UPI001E5DFE34|nr:hypothetical protein [Sphingomonas formosensis]
MTASYKGSIDRAAHMGRLALMLLPLAAAASCHSGKQDAAASGGADSSGRISCALAGEAEFKPVCDIERSTDEGGIVLTVHHPDGGFRRLRVMKDGRGVVAADGALPARVTLSGDRQIEVAIAGDRYRLPATIKRPAPAAP